mgnify:CR=1 FL=1
MLIPENGGTLREMIRRALPIAGPVISAPMRPAPDPKELLNEHGNRPPMAMLHEAGHLNRHTRRAIGARLRQRAKIEQKYGKGETKTKRAEEMSYEELKRKRDELRRLYGDIGGNDG